MRILVVDDNKSIRKNIKIELENHGFQVFEASNGFDALDILLSTSVDLITMDVEMPNLNGFETYKRLRSSEWKKSLKLKDFLPPPVIFITEQDTFEERIKGFNHGAIEFLSKPILKGELVNRIQKILNPKTIFNGLTALVAEDSKVVRFLLKDILTAEGIDVLEAENGYEALEIYKQNQSKIDLIVTDVIMPQMSGEELCKKIRYGMKNENIPIFFLSSLNEQSYILKMFRAGGTDYLSKPFTKEEFLARLHVHLNVVILNKNLKKNIEELKKLNKLKDNFLAICSHDLKSPITSIKGYAEIMSSQTVDDQTTKNYAKQIFSSSEFLISLVNDLLSLSQIQTEDQPLETYPISIQESIEDTLSTLNPMAKSKNITIESRTKSQTDWILGNHTALQRIVTNIITNSIKFTPKEGRIELLLQEVENDRLELAIRDNGVGMSKEKLNSIFQPFSRTSDLGTEGEAGTGLGYSIIRNLIGKLNGQLDVTSNLGKGTLVKISFPQIREQDLSNYSFNKKLSLQVNKV